MTHNANKRRTHNEAARAAKQQVRGKAGTTGPGIRRTGYGARLAGMRQRAAADHDRQAVGATTGRAAPVAPDRSVHADGSVDPDGTASPEGHTEPRPSEGA